MYTLGTLYSSVPGVPYYVTIGAVNDAGQGDNTTVIAFTAINGKPVVNYIHDKERN